MNDNPPPVSRFRFWTWTWFWSVSAAIVTVGIAAWSLTNGGSNDISIADWVQLAFGLIGIAVLPPLALYEIGHIYKHPPRFRPNWFWLLLAGIFIGFGWNGYVVWDAATGGQALRPVAVVISFLAWSVSLLLLAHCLRALWKFSRWMWVPRRRYWIWLWAWSLAVAAVTIILTGRSPAFTKPWADDDITRVRQEIGFIAITLIVLLASYLFICTCKNPPRSWKAWFWLAFASVSSGILWASILTWSGRAEGLAFSRSFVLFSFLTGAVFFLFAAALIQALRNFFRWLFSWRILKRGLLALAGLTIFVAAFYAEENWRGRHAWENYRHGLEAKGEKFDLLAFAPPPVPDDQNFAMASIVATSYEWLLDKSGHRITPPKTNMVMRMVMSVDRTDNYYPTNRMIGSWQQARLTNLKPWQDYYRATTYTNDRGFYSGREHIEIIQLDTNKFPVAPQPQSPAADVLLALSRYDTALAELRQAGERPYSRFPLNYQDGNAATLMLPHLGSLERCATFLQLRAIAEVQAGQTEPALADVKLMLRLAQSVHDEPTLISHLNCLRVAEPALQPVWEGLAERRWSEAQMKELSAQLEKLDFISDLQIALHGERASALGYIELCRKFRVDENGTMLNAVCPRFISSLEKASRYLPGMPGVSSWFYRRQNQSPGKDSLMLTLCRLPPAGWYDWNKVALAKMYQEHLFPIAQPEKHLVSLKAATEANQFIGSAGQPSNINPQDALALMFVASSAYSVQKTAKAQNAVDMAIVACALELYYLAQGDYPESLAELAPEYLKTIPPDVVNGQPLHYRRTQDGRYMLYSVGWDGKDDGGVVGRRESGSLAPWLGDWVWQYPAQ